ncbi:MAG: CpaF family protein [Anaerolineales bacterium]|jgi:pilus assembly protein CpaF
MVENAPLTLEVSKKRHLIKYLRQNLASELEKSKVPQAKEREFALQTLKSLYTRTRLQLPDALRAEIFETVIESVLGYGPIQVFLNDPDVSEVMVNGSKQVYVERKGKLRKTDAVFDDDDHVIQIIKHIVTPLGRQVDVDHPAVDARLPDGSRVNAVIPPVAIDGPSITIRKFTQDKLGAEQLVAYGSLTKTMAEFLEACVVSRLNVVISGGTGSGKTTLLNVLSGYIPEDERIVTIEDAAELQLRQEHIVRMETKSPNKRGAGAMTVRDLVRNSLRMRPDRIVVGEVRGGEALDMLQAMNTGHDGSLTTVHANTPRDAISRLETLVLMSGLELPVYVVRQQIASAVNLIVQQTRLRDGSRKITQITEVIGMEGDTIVLSDLFKFEQSGLGEDSKVLGEHKSTGIRPTFEPRLEAAGFKLGPEVFGVNIAEMLAANRNGNGRRR